MIDVSVPTCNVIDVPRPGGHVHRELIVVDGVPRRARAARHGHQQRQRAPWHHHDAHRQDATASTAHAVPRLSPSNAATAPSHYSRWHYRRHLLGTLTRSTCQAADVHHIPRCT
ncbi:hypothetical protein EVAR_22106_1 [Eumeta japonica]|uniref:Uncharacterized protein n=1 Tax=Eumeta variegata TaxID=151549 RepID=A0A4C1W0Y9_EUMVA|nr:hypothetical protein EVAR_22106_1 [Eumeta japonica]